MKKLCSLIVAAVLLVPGFVLAGNPVDTSHPIFSEKNWNCQAAENFYLTDPDKTKIIWSALTSCTNSRYKMNIYAVFGETVFKGFSVYDERGNVSEHWFQLEKDGVWYTVKTEYFVREWIIDYPSGKVASVIIILEDDNGNEIVRREVKRK